MMGSVVMRSSLYVGQIESNEVES
ncbi:gustatory receptor 30, partial [Danaus plexippus plexippus]